MTESQTKGTILAVGELLWDVLPNERLLGGAPANFCFRLRQLGVPALLVSRIGNDPLGIEISAALAAKDFNLSLVQRDSAWPTGTVDVTLTPGGSPSFTINKGVAYDHLEVTPDLLAAAQSSIFICFGTLMQRTAQSRDAIYAVLDAAHSATKLLDINLRKDCFSEEILIHSLERADILKLNIHEGKILTELLHLKATTPSEVALELLERFELTAVLTTRGEHGVSAVDSTNNEIYIPGIPVQVADTIGSGDCFAAGFTYKFLQGASLTECCRYGNMVGAMNAARKGGMPNITRAEVDAFIVSQH